MVSCTETTELGHLELICMWGRCNWRKSNFGEMKRNYDK